MACDSRTEPKAIWKNHRDETLQAANRILKTENRELLTASATESDSVSVNRI